MDARSKPISMLSWTYDESGKKARAAPMPVQRAAQPEDDTARALRQEKQKTLALLASMGLAGTDDAPTGGESRAPKATAEKKKHAELHAHQQEEVDADDVHGEGEPSDSVEDGVEQAHEEAEEAREEEQEAVEEENAAEETVEAGVAAVEAEEEEAVEVVEAEEEVAAEAAEAEEEAAADVEANAEEAAAVEAVEAEEEGAAEAVAAEEEEAADAEEEEAADAKADAGEEAAVKAVEADAEQQVDVKDADGAQEAEQTPEGGAVSDEAAANESGESAPDANEQANAAVASGLKAGTKRAPASVAATAPTGAKKTKTYDVAVPSLRALLHPDANFSLLSVLPPVPEVRPSLTHSHTPHNVHIMHTTHT